MTPAEQDPFPVLWAWKRLVQRARLPAQRVVVRFVLTDRPRERYWLVLSRTGVELCIRPPGLDEDLVVTTDSDTLVRVHMGRLSLVEAGRRERWLTEGSPEVVGAFPCWVGLSPFAGVVPA